MSDQNSFVPKDPSKNKPQANPGGFNAQNFKNLSQLPPGVQEQIKNAFDKLGADPHMTTAMEHMANLAMGARMNGIGVTSMKTEQYKKVQEMIKQRMTGKAGNYTPADLTAIADTLKTQLGVNNSFSNLNQDQLQKIAQAWNNASTSTGTKVIESSSTNIFPAKTKSADLSPASTTPMFDKTQPRPSLQPFSSNYNPHIKNDSWRKIIWAVLIIIIVGYLIYHFGLHDQLPS